MIKKRTCNDAFVEVNIIQNKLYKLKTGSDEYIELKDEWEVLIKEAQDLFEQEKRERPNSALNLFYELIKVDEINDENKDIIIENINEMTDNWYKFVLVILQRKHYKIESKIANNPVEEEDILLKQELELYEKIIDKVNRNQHGKVVDNYALEHTRECAEASKVKRYQKMLSDVGES